MKQIHDKRAMSVRITDKEAVGLINNRAACEHRSASNAATLTVIESLSKKQNPGQAKFLDVVVLKGGDAKKSNENL